jgi:adenosylcobinamide kinase / adenosylcobinamide-phosphate guanylyltransferase
MDSATPVAVQATTLSHCREFVLGGQRSGKSRFAEDRAQAWLALSPLHRVVLIATARASDDEMRQRILRHKEDRARRVPGMATIEEPVQLAKEIAAQSNAPTLVLVDCLTMWLTNLLMPSDVLARVQLEALDIEPLRNAIGAARGPLVLVGNEIGLGVVPMGHEVRDFVDTLGRLNQAVAKACDRVTLMAAGLPLTLKDASR